MAIFAKYEPPAGIFKSYIWKKTAIFSAKKDDGPIENGTMLGPMRVEDVKKEMYQLVATTTDPNLVGKSWSSFIFFRKIWFLKEKGWSSLNYIVNLV